MFGLGLSELVVLGVLALILIGPKQLPEVARTLGRFINDLKRSAEDITEEIKKQAKVDLDIGINKDFFEPRKKTRDPNLPIPVMQDRPVENKIEATKPVASDEKPEIVVQAPDQMTFTFQPEVKTTIENNDKHTDEKKEQNGK